MLNILHQDLEVDMLKLLLQALKGGMREKVQIATKFGVIHKDGNVEIHGEPEYVRGACEASLMRLDIDCIDLYFAHRIDIRIPIEVTVSTFARITLLKYDDCILATK